MLTVANPGSQNDDDRNPFKDAILRRIEKRLRVIGLEPATASIAAGLGPDLIRDWMRKPKAMPRIDSLFALAPILQTTASWLAYGEGSETLDRAADLPAARSVPIISWVAASQFSRIEDVADISDAPRILQTGLPSGVYFALIVKGDSMDMIAPEGSTIIVAANERDLVHRRLYVVRRHDGATFKRYMATPPHLEPASYNPLHEPIEITEDMRVVGRAVRVIRDV